jgi:DNA-directed RNA polymerase sigma subunit (sigma70/sigma32)
MNRAQFEILSYERDRAMTLESIAEILGVKKERVRQIEFEALRKVKLALIKRGFSERDIVDHLNTIPSWDGGSYAAD